jgi:chromate reductase, NAD(P)H dehydrogenase (quinone)
LAADNRIKILAISGSLRANSSNNAVLLAAAGMVGDHVDFTMYKGLGSLPHFDDSKEPAVEVSEFRRLLREADGVLICSPEYAFGVPGVLKNALDWTVSSGELVYKPLALITAATGGDKAHASLLLTFTALSAQVPEECRLLISFIRSKMDASGSVTDTATLQAIQAVMNGLVSVIEANKINEQQPA